MQFNIPAEFKNASGVYIIRNTVNEKVYVGSAVNFRKRYSGHLSHLRREKHASRHMQRHCNKYGLECFSFNLLELVADNPTQLLEIESKYIELFDAANSEKGFNNMPASMPARHSDATKAKLKTLLSSYITPEIIARRSNAIRATGEKRREARLAVRITCPCCQKEFWPRSLGKKQSKFCGHECSSKYPISEATREKQRVSSTGRKRSFESIEKGRLKQIARGDVRTSEGKERQRLAASNRVWSEDDKARSKAHLAHPDVVAKRIASIKAKGAHNKSLEIERQRTCEFCRKTFLAEYPKKTIRFCSRTCFYNFQREQGPPNKRIDVQRNRTCLHCSAEFVSPPSAPHRTCSKICGYALRKAETAQRHTQLSI